nr:T9SS type A sorting domain-containing protein [Bacteroidota bacterium]
PQWLGNHTGSWTISFWINASNFSPNYFFSNTTGNGGFRCFFTNSTLVLTGGVPSVGLNMPLFPGTPTVVTYVYDQSLGTVSGYKNGIFQTSSIIGPSFPLVGANFAVGAYSFPFYGMMDEFRMYNRALSFSEIMATWNQPLPMPPCASTPNGGTATASKNEVCPSDIFTIGLAGHSVATGISYQWQSASSSTGPWTNISGANNSFGNFSQTANTWYRCEVTCANSSLSAFSSVSQVLAYTTVPMGTFTINSALPTAGTNFNSFNDAVAYIFCGIAGPVTFNVAPNSGPYLEQFEIFQIPNTSSTNTVTFNGNNNTISFLTTIPAENHIIKLNGAKHITLNELNIVSISASNNFAVQFNNGADFNTINNCFIDLSSTFADTGVSNAGIVANESSNLSITNCSIKGGYYGISIKGAPSSNSSINNLMSNNSITDFYHFGIHTELINSSSITNNQVHRPTRALVGIFVGIALFTGGQNNLIEKNKIFASFGGLVATNTQNSYGIYFSAVFNTINNENIIVNNLINLKGNNGQIYGLYNSNSSHLKFYHNTVSIDDANSTSGNVYAFYQSFPVSGIDVRNNVFSITRAGTGNKFIFYCLAIGPTVSNYNVLHLGSSGGTSHYGYLYGPRSTFASWQTASSPSYDQNSSIGNPVFFNPPIINYRPTNLGQDNMGIPLGVTTDLTGASRSLTTPDVGAYEFTNPQNDVQILNINNSFGPCYAPNDTILVNLKNTLSALLDFSVLNLSIDWEITGNIILSGTKIINSGTLASGITSNFPIITGIDLSAIGTYNISATVTALWDENLSNNFTAKVINVVPVTAFASVSSACLGSLIDLTLNGYSGSPVQWQVDTGLGFTNINGALSNQHIEPLTENSVFRAIYCTNKASAPVSVNAIFVAPPVAFGDSVCFGQNAIAAATSNLAISWHDASWGGNLLGTGSSFQVNNLQQNTTVYAQTSDGLGMNCPSVRIPVELAIGDVPVIVLPSDTAFCDGKNVVLNPGSGASIYSWSTGQNTQSIQVGSAGTFVLTATSSLGCASNASIQVSVFPLPKVIANASADAVCFGDSITLFGSGAISYSWYNNITNGIPFIPSATMAYTVTGVDSNSCSNTSLVMVVVNPLPIVELPAFEKTCIEYPPFLLTGGKPSGGYYSSTGPSVSGGSFDPATAGNGIHTITYNYEDANKCRNSASAFIEVESCLAIRERSLAPVDVKLYPNPSFNYFVLEINIHEKQNVEFMLFDLNGKLITKESLMMDAGVNKINFNSSQYARGLYLMKINSNGYSLNQRIVLN